VIACSWAARSTQVGMKREAGSGLCTESMRRNAPGIRRPSDRTTCVRGSRTVRPGQKPRLPFGWSDGDRVLVDFCQRAETLIGASARMVPNGTFGWGRWVRAAPPRCQQAPFARASVPHMCPNAETLGRD
jgi:hypothetical protein